MRRAVPNLTAVQASCSARPTAVLAEHQGSAVSRRHALGLAGLAVAVAGAAPALRAVETLVLGSYTRAWTAKHRLAFSLGGQER